MSGIISILEGIAFRVGHLDQVIVSVIIKFAFCLCIFLHTDDVSLVIVQIAFCKVLPVQGKTVKSCHIGFVTVDTADFDLLIRFFRDKDIIQELPGCRICLKFTRISLPAAVCPDKRHFQSEHAAVFPFRRITASPYIAHITVPGFSGDPQRLRQLLYLCRVSRHIKDMLIQHFCLHRFYGWLHPCTVDISS